MERLHIGTLSLMDTEILSWKVKIDFFGQKSDSFQQCKSSFFWSMKEKSERQKKLCLSNMVQPISLTADDAFKMQLQSLLGGLASQKEIYQERKKKSKRIF